jgi:hypothetical protein
MQDRLTHEIAFAVKAMESRALPDAVPSAGIPEKPTSDLNSVFCLAATLLSKEGRQIAAKILRSEAEARRARLILQALISELLVTAGIAQFCWSMTALHGTIVAVVQKAENRFRNPPAGCRLADAWSPSWHGLGLSITKAGQDRNPSVKGWKRPSPEGTAPLGRSPPAKRLPAEQTERKAAPQAACCQP